MKFEDRIPTMLSLGVDPSALPQLKSYVDLLWQANNELNLISRKMTFSDLLDNHLIDCLLAYGRLPEKLETAADLGSGGGMPGVVYAILRSQTRYQLYEKSPKKREFLERCRELAPNLEIHGDIPRDLPGVELVTARAFKPIQEILDFTRDYCRRGGKYFLLKGRRERIDEELALAQRKFKDLHPQIEVLNSPLLSVERHLVLL